MKENPLLLDEKKNPGMDVNYRLQKMQVELAFEKNQFSQLQDQCSKRGVCLTQMEEQIASMKKESTKCTLFHKKFEGHLQEGYKAPVARWTPCTVCIRTKKILEPQWLPPKI